MTQENKAREWQLFAFHDGRQFVTRVAGPTIGANSERVKVVELSALEAEREKVRNLVEVIKASFMFGVSHFEDCAYLNEDGDEEICNCGGYALSVKQQDAIKEIEEA